MTSAIRRPSMIVAIRISICAIHAGSTIRWWLRNAAAVEGNSTYRSQSIRQLRKRIMSLDLLCGMLSHTHTTGNCTGCIGKLQFLSCP